MYECLYVLCMYECMYLCVNICIYVCMYVRTYVFMCVCVYIYIYIYVRTRFDHSNIGIMGLNPKRSNQSYLLSILCCPV